MFKHVETTIFGNNPAWSELYELIQKWKEKNEELIKHRTALKTLQDEQNEIDRVILQKLSNLKAGIIG